DEAGVVRAALPEHVDDLRLLRAAPDGGVELPERGERGQVAAEARQPGEAIGIEIVVRRRQRRSAGDVKALRLRLLARGLSLASPRLRLRGGGRRALVLGEVFLVVPLVVGRLHHAARGGQRT